VAEIDAIGKEVTHADYVMMPDCSFSSYSALKDCMYKVVEPRFVAVTDPAA